MNSAQTGVLHDASRAVTETQTTHDTVKNSPSRSAHRRLRINLARGSAAALSFSASTSDQSAAVSTPRCTSVRQASGRPAREFISMPYESYCDSGFSGGGATRRQLISAHGGADLLQPGMPGHLHALLLHFEHAALHRVLRELGRTDGIGVAAFYLVAHLIQARGVARRCELAHRPKRSADLLLHLGLLELAEQLGALGDLRLQHHRV